MTDTERLLSLSSADPGFYILALHAYIENTLKKRYPGIDDSVSWKMMNEYREILRSNGVTSGRELEFIYSLKREHSVTNRVRHQFETVSTGIGKSLILLKALEKALRLRGIPVRPPQCVLTDILIQLTRMIPLWIPIIFFLMNPRTFCPLS